MLLLLLSLLLLLLFVVIYEHISLFSGISIIDFEQVFIYLGKLFNF